MTEVGALPLAQGERDGIRVAQAGRPRRLGAGDAAAGGWQPTWRWLGPAGSGRRGPSGLDTPGGAATQARRVLAAPVGVGPAGC